MPLAEHVHQQLVTANGNTDRGVKQEGWRVLTHADMPAILIEVGYLTNPEEERWMYKQGVLQKTANAIVEGIIHYFTAMDSNRDASVKE